MDALLAFAIGWLTSVKYIAAVYAGGLVLEWLFPAEDGQPASRLRFNIVAGLLLLAISGLLVAALYPLIVPLISPPRGQRIRVEMPDGLAGSFAQAFLYFLVYDFFYYWWHRAQHRFAWLWPQHELHHSDSAVNVSTSMRHHWLEDPLRIFTISLPLGFLFYFKPASVPWVATAIGLWPFFIHLNVRLELGWLTPVVAGPQYHRIYHSLHAEHVNHNYAAFLPVWDILFGTAWLPRRGEFPPTGIARGEPPDLLNALGGPLLDWRRMLLRPGVG